MQAEVRCLRLTLNSTRAASAQSSALRRKMARRPEAVAPTSWRHDRGCRGRLRLARCRVASREFARRAGVRQTTVRHYLREGLLSPRTGPAGGSRPYLEFTESDLRLLSAIQAS
ncbi:MerR family transcriptional regulator [Variovorax atrisoli]|uniref:MerR family transcriptional regulator n=1 Tax=Variovorax atrisoli TaxID=3394203 RepID=UPI0033997FF5